MEIRSLGKTGLEVSRLCFGGLTIGPLQANLSKEDGAKVIVEAYNRGVNFIDTAELYETYIHINEALKTIPRDKFIISTKSYAWSRETAEKSFLKACEELGTDYIDLFMLHEQESEHTLRGHSEALAYFLERKEKGDIKAVGLSTHHIAGVKAANMSPEIEVVHPILNKSGLGIQDGTLEEMLAELSRFKERGGGIFGMKPLGGGNLLATVDECFDFVLGLDMVDSIAVGMQRVSEVIANTTRFSGGTVPREIQSQLRSTPRRLHIDDWCIGCKACEEKCKSDAIHVIDGQAVVDHKKCVLCAYCSAVCPEFCIKVV